MATIFVKEPTVNYTGTSGNDAFIATEAISNLRPRHHPWKWWR